MLAETHVVGGAVRQGELILAARRGPEMSLAGEWEFPGGKIEPGESAQEALVRELHEELRIEVAVGEIIGRSTFTTATRRIVLDIYWCEIVDGEPTPTEHSELRWVRPDELSQLDWATADIPIVAMIVDGTQ